MKTKKLSFKEISGVMSRSEMKKIMAGSGTTGGCQQNIFYSGPEGCGTGHFWYSDAGGCHYKIQITEPQPCGWA